jgi:hypothetical protein
MDLSVGDQVRVSEGFKENGVAFRNNEIAKVAAIDGEKITLNDGRQIARDFARLDQGVCITSYATECRTVDQIVPVLPMRTFGQVNDEAWYVLVSRARHRVVAFTDCKEALHEQVMLDGDRKSVWEHERDERRRQQRERDHAGQPDKAQVADLQKGAVKRAQQAASRAEERERHVDLAQAQKRQQGQSLEHGIGM